MSILQERIKSKRLSTGLTLSEVADLIGVKEATMQRYESGEIKNIKHDTIVKLSNIFHCTPQYLMGWTDDDELSSNSNKTHMDKYNKLNDIGKLKLNERLDELLELPKYRKEWQTFVLCLYYRTAVLICQ